MELRPMKVTSFRLRKFAVFPFFLDISEMLRNLSLLSIARLYDSAAQMAWGSTVAASMHYPYIQSESEVVNRT